MSKIQRNAPCPCGSGLKLKKCCIDFYQNLQQNSACHDPHCTIDHNNFDPLTPYEVYEDENNYAKS